MRTSEQCGFTLIEVLVSMMLLAISLAVIMQLFSAGLKSLPGVDNHTRAVFHAREKMEEILLENQTLVLGVTQGEFEDDFRWMVEILEFQRDNADEKGEQEDNSNEMLFEIHVVISWDQDGKEKNYDVSTLKGFMK